MLIRCWKHAVSRYICQVLAPNTSYRSSQHYIRDTQKRTEGGRLSIDKKGPVFAFSHHYVGTIHEHSVDFRRPDSFLSFADTCCERFMVIGQCRQLAQLVVYRSDTPNTMVRHVLKYFQESCERGTMFFKFLSNVTSYRQSLWRW